MARVRQTPPFERRFNFSGQPHERRAKVELRVVLPEVSRMQARVGDLILVESERAAQSGRRGVIEEVLQEEPSRLRVHWDDGHTTVFCPSDGVARIEAQKQKRKS
jgi:hypothetical protein